jgi:autotransporter-associated beta strand protein
VLFDDSGSGNPAVTLQGALRPATTTVNTSANYSFSGSGRIGGDGSLTKQGAGLLTISTANDYAGPTLVLEGTVKPGNASAFGATNSTIGISNGATLDLGSFSLGTRSVVVQGVGVGGAGAILNSGASQTNAMPLVTLTGDTTFGGPARWDVRPNPIAGFLGNGFNLTKISGNEIWLADVGPSGLGDINVNQGLLGFQASSTLGDPLKTLTLASNTTVALRNTDNNVLNKKVVFNQSSWQSLAGDNVLAGTVTLNGSNVIACTNIFTVQAGISGPGGLTKIGSGTLALTANNTYTGTTYIAAGTLQVRNTGALGVTNGGTIITTGGRLDLNAISLGGESVTVQGTGLGNAGAIVNTGGQQLNALRFLTLSGNTSLGGIGRWDLRANPTAVLNGNNFTLTKTGVNEIWLVDVGGTGLANITVNEGLLGIQGTTTLGNTANTITINSAGSLDFWGNGTNILSKIMTLSGGRIVNGSGSNTFAGPVTLSNSNNFEIASGTMLAMAGTMGGSGSFRAGSPGTLILVANNGYTGPTTIAAGVVQCGVGSTTGTPGSGMITNNATLTFNRNNTFTIANQIFGTGALNQGVVNAANPVVGSTLILTANNQYTGNTVINGNGNIIAAGTDTALGKGMVIFNGNNNGVSMAGIRSANAATRNLTNDLQFGGGNQILFGVAGSGDLGFFGTNVFTTSADKLVIVSNNITRLNNAIGNNSRIIKDGPGLLILGGNNTNGGLTINLGTVRIDAQTRLGRNPASFTANHLTLNGGVLETTATFAINDSNRGVTLSNAGGIFDVNTGTTLTLGRVITGPGSLTKTDGGTLILSAPNTYAGATTNLNGTTIVNGSIQGAAVAVVGGTVAGTGTIKAPVTVEPGGALSPGISVGTLIISNQLTLLGTLTMELDKTSAANDSITGLSNVVYGGTLNLSFLSEPPALGDSYKLFDSANYSGSFASILPAAPGPFLAWDTNSLATDGTLRVVVDAAQFNPPLLSGGNLILNGTQGAPNGGYSILSSTNLGLPVAEWTLVGTNVFDGSGNFTFTNAINPATPQLFYLIQYPR